VSESLYDRPLTNGPIIRVRRTSIDGETPVRAVLEIDRRGGQLRAEQTAGHPPPLVEGEGESDSDVLAKLLPMALEDAEVARLMRDKGLR
jgi:hypothetical protein